jgi:hypothetical protein
MPQELTEDKEDIVCPKGFESCKINELMEKIKQGEITDHLSCPYQNRNCPYSFPYGGNYLCKCLLRENLKQAKEE